MKTVLLAVLILCPVFLQASAVKIISPTTAQTYAYSSVTWHSLHWDANRRRLKADITFSTEEYAMKPELRAEESFAFEFPGVKFDPQTGTFFVKTPQRERVTVAVLTNNLVGKSIKPARGTQILVCKRSGKVTVVLLAAGNQPTGGHDCAMHWIEVNEGFYLDNLVSAGVEALRR